MSAELMIPSAVSVTTGDMDKDQSKWVVDWSTVERNRLAMYTAGVNEKISGIHIPLDVLECSATYGVDHRSAIDEYYRQIMSRLHESSLNSIAREVRGGC